MAEYSVPDLYFENLSFVKDVEKYFEDAQHEAGKQSVEILKNILISQGRYASGALVKSIEYRILATPEEYIAPQVYFTEPGLSYAPYLEEGMPPEDVESADELEPKIRAWADKKGINVKSISNIVYRLQERGYKGKPYIRKAEQEIEKNYSRHIAKLVSEYKKRI